MPVKTDRRNEAGEEKWSDQDPAGLREREEEQRLGRKGSRKLITRQRRYVVARTKITSGINTGPSEAPEMTDRIISVR